MDNNSYSVPPADLEDVMNRTPDIERIKAAKKRRSIQLKKWHQYNKMKEKEEQLRQKKGFPASRRGIKCVRFNQNLILLEAGYRGDIDEVRRLLSEGVCADVANDDGLTALHQCAINNNLEMCLVLIQHKANVNAKDKELWTPMHAAAICGHKSICTLLIKNGADLLALNADGNMPYDICEEDTTLDELETAMSQRGVSQKMIDEARAVPERKMLAELKTMVGKTGLVAAQTVFSQIDRQGATMLHVACAMGALEVARFLFVSLGMHPDLLDKDGWQPIHVAALYGHLDLVELLLSHGADIDALTEPGGETVYELVYDQNVYDQLLQLKREVERVRSTRLLQQQQGQQGHQVHNSLGIPGSTQSSSFGLVRRRSSTNPRSASIRRSSMKEKSNLSWKEARQEAEIRLSIERKNNNSVSKPSSGGASRNHGPCRDPGTSHNSNHSSSDNNSASNKVNGHGHHAYDSGGGNKHSVAEPIDENDLDEEDTAVCVTKVQVDFSESSLPRLPNNGTLSKPQPRSRPILVEPGKPNPIKMQVPAGPNPRVSSGTVSTQGQVSLRRSQETIAGAVPPTGSRKSPVPMPRHQQSHTGAAGNNHTGSSPHQQKRTSSSQLSTRSTGSTHTSPINSSSGQLRASQESLRKHNKGTPIPVRQTNHKLPKQARPDSCCSVM